MRPRPAKPQRQVDDLEHVDPKHFEAYPCKTEEEREPQLFDNQVRHKINEDNMQLPTTTPGVQSVSFNSNIQTADFFSEDPRRQFYDMTHEPTFEQDAFFVEGSFASANTQNPQNQSILKITSSETTQTSHHPILVLAQIDNTTFAETVIWHWPEKTRCTTSCNPQKRKRKKR